MTMRSFGKLRGLLIVSLCLNACGGGGLVYGRQSSGPPPDQAAVIVHTADLNADGKPDAIAADFLTGTLTLVLNEDIGKSPKYQFTLEPGLNDIATGNLNGDGLPDIVVSNFQTNQISIFLSSRK